jgi:hypothetical protein
MSSMAPIITRATYDGSSVKVWWTPSADPDVLGYVIRVSASAGGVVIESSQIPGRTAAFGTLALSGALNTNSGYTVEVVAMWSTGPGQVSTALSLLTALPELVQAYYDGSDLHFEWTPTLGAALGYLLKVYSLDSGATYYVTVADPYAGSGTIPASVLPNGGLGASEQWLVAVCAQGAGGISACTAGANLPKPLPSFVLAAASYRGGQTIAASWAALGGTIVRYRIELSSPQSGGRQFVDIPNGSATNGSLGLSAPLAPGQTYTLRVIALTAAGTGVATPASRIVSALPVLAAAEYQGDKVRLSWADSSDITVQNYLLSVVSLSTGNSWTATVGQGEHSGNVATGALDAAQDYVASVAAQAPSAVAGVSATWPLLAQRPHVAGALYDTQSVAVTWTPLPRGIAQSYELSLLVDGTATQSVLVDNPLAATATLNLAAPLDTAKPAAVRVTAQSSAGAAARSEDLALLLAPPTCRYVTYDGSQVLAGWNLASGAARYVFAVVGASTGVRYSVSVDSAAATTAKLQLPGQLGTQEAFLYSLTAQATSGAAVALPAAPLPTALPRVETLSYDGKTVRARWSMPDVQAAVLRGFTASVVDEDSGTTYSATVDDPSAREAVVEGLPAGGLDSARRYTGKVAALSAGTANAQSTGIRLVSAAPAIRYATYYGDKVTASWALVQGANESVASYELSVNSTQDRSEHRVSVPKSATFATLALAQPLSAAQSYAVNVSAVSADGIARAVSTLEPVVGQRPRLLSVLITAAQVQMTWEASTNLAVTGYTLKVISLSSGNTLTQTIDDPGATSGAVAIPQGLDPAQLWQAQVWANAPVASVSDSTTVLAQAPTLRAVRYDGHRAEAEWAALTPGSVQGQSGFLLSATSSGTTVSSVFATGSSAGLAIPDGTAAPAVQLAMAGPGSTGLPTASITLLASAPDGLTLTTDAVSGNAVLSWQAVTGAAGYTIAFSDGRAAAQVTEARYPFPKAPAADVSLGVSVTPTATTDNVAVTGPASLPFALPTARADLGKADYDGSALDLEWSAVAGATAYRISVLAGQETTPVQQVDTPDAATHYRLTPTFSDYTKTYRVVVQALAGSSSGPPSQARDLFHSGWFVSRAAASTYAPFAYPATSLATVMSSDLGQKGADILIYLPDLGAGTALRGLPLPQPPFTLAANPDRSSPYPYTLSVPGTSSAWNFGTAPIRSDVLNAYVALLKAAEVAGAVPQGIVQLQQAIARYLPQTFQETLYYSYGLAFPNPSADIVYGSADLRPGMVLRVVFNDYMAVGGTNTQQWLNGYVGGSLIDYDVGSYLSSAGWAVGFDAFIAQLVANGALSVTAPPTHPSLQLEGGMAEAADLFYPDFREPFYRLFFPTTLVSPSGVGTSQTAPNFVLAAAPTYTSLSTATNVPGPGSTVAYFRGRAVVKLCIRIVVNGNDTVVPIGTTVGNLLDRWSRQPPNVARALKGVKLERALEPVVLDAAAALDAARSYPVRLDWQTLPQYAPAWNALALPLLHGDRLTIED